MTKRLLKTRKDHAKVRAMMTEATVTLTMTPAAGALTAGENGTEYAGVTFALSSGAIGGSNFSVVSGTLPPGLSLVGNSLEGTPTETDDYSFSIRGADDFGNSVTNAYTLSVTDPA
jgi:hypothetical protein